MADDHPIPAYPLMFDPSQFANKYSPFAGKAIPFPAQYRGTPTDAHGNPIQSYLDTQAQHDAWAAANPAPQPQQAAPVTLNSNPYGGMFGANPSSAGNQVANADKGSFGGWSPAGQTMPRQTQQQAAPQQAAPTNPYDMNQAYLDALANPGKVTTPGATVAQSAPPSNQSGVLQQFLANWKNQGSPTQGAGNYNNAGFFNALQGMV